MDQPSNGLNKEEEGAHPTDAQEDTLKDTILTVSNESQEQASKRIQQLKVSCRKLLENTDNENEAANFPLFFAT